MSLLAPLYIAGLIALSAPILFHLIRRTPRGRQVFSSLMFLSPSPPRLTRRSRLDHLLLLLLRAGALALIALAFARPFLRKMEQLDLGAGAQLRTAILLDASASMRRDGSWQAAVSKAREAIDRTAPDDLTALAVFADAPVWLATFEDVAQSPPSQRKALLLSRLEQARPTWGAGDLGSALVAAADALDSLDAARRDDKPSDERLEIVLIGDLAEGADLAALEAYEWPERVRLSVQEATPTSPGNAGLHLATGALAGDELGVEDKSSRRKPSLRVRVVNAADSTQQAFTLSYADARGVSQESAAQVQVPAGESRIVKLPLPSKAFDRLVLSGDRQPFDNEIFLPRSPPSPGNVYYFGEESAEDPSESLYYLRRAIGEDRSLQVNPAALPTARVSADSPGFVVFGSSLSTERLAEVEKLLGAGGSALLLVNDSQAGATIGKLAGAAPTSSVELEEAPVKEFALLGEIDFGDPLFAPFADPRFGDFTGIHFWRYRRLAPSAFADLFPSVNSHVLARFDSGDPALIERRVGAGRLWVLMTTWRPSDSELSRSSKFVPLVWGMLAAGEMSDLRRTVYRVGDRVPIAPASATGDESRNQSIVTPAGERLSLTPPADFFNQTDAPGVYRLEGSSGREFAVNLAAEESRTARMPLEQLESRGVALTGAERKAKQAAHQRQLLDMELEGRQQAWRWLLAGALALLVAETIVAGRAARKVVQPAL